MTYVRCNYYFETLTSSATERFETLVPGYLASKSRRHCRHCFPTSSIIGSCDPEKLLGAPNKSFARDLCGMMHVKNEQQKNRKKKLRHKPLLKSIEEGNEWKEKLISISFSNLIFRKSSFGCIGPCKALVTSFSLKNRVAF